MVVSPVGIPEPAVIVSVLAIVSMKARHSQYSTYHPDRVSIAHCGEDSRGRGTRADGGSFGLRNS